MNGTAGNANQALNGGGSIIFAGTNGAAAYGGLGFGTSLPSATFGALEGNGNFSLLTTNGATRLTVGGNNATTTYSGVLSGSGSLVKVGGGELTLSGFNTMTGGLTISGGTVALVASGGTGTLPNNTNIYVNSSAELLINGADSLGYNPGTNIYLTDGLVSVTSGNRGSFNIISMTGGTIGSAPGIGDGSGNWLLNGQLLATLDSAGNAAMIDSTEFALNSAGGTSFNVTRGIAATGADLIVSSNIVNWQYNATPVNNAGVSMLTKTGNGLMLLTGSNGYSGGTTVNGGTLQMGLGDSNALGSTITAPLAMTSGLLDLNGNSLSVGAFSGSGTVDNVSAGGLITLTIGNGGGGGAFSGSIKNTSGTLALVKAGAGTEVLSGTNTYTGGTTLSGGLVNFTPSALPFTTNPANITFNGGGLQYAAGNTEDISAGIAPIAAGQAAIIDTGTNSVAFNSPLSGSGGLTKAGAGTLSLNVPNSFTGPTTVTGGTLNVGDPAGIALLNSDVAVNFNGVTGAPGTLSMSVPAATVGSLAGAGNVNLNSGQLTVGVKNTSTTFSGSILGAGTGFIKSGSGTMTLTGNSAYTGPTTIASGTLLFAQDPSTGIKFSTNRGGGTYTVTGEAGVVPMNNWANVAGLNVTGVAVNNNNNANVGTTVTVTTAGDNWDSYNGNQANQNAQLLNSYLDNTGGSMNVSVSGIPYASYSVYVYFNADAPAVRPRCD